MYSIKNEINVFGNTYPLKRYIGTSEGDLKGENVVFFGSIHGNEPSGFVAIHHFFKVFESHNLQKKLKGSIYGIAGNLRGLSTNKRYVKNDLNRIWTPEIMKRVHQQKLINLKEEEQEQKALLTLIQEMIHTKKDRINFLDLHTTSGPTIPFVTINDTLANRRLAGFLPIPTVLGIEEFLEGTVMDFINDLGYPAVGIESGQHQDEKSVALHLASIWVSLVAIGSLKKEDIPDFNSHYRLLRDSAGFEYNKVYEVKYREEITPADNFKMLPGYSNFQSIRKNEVLANTTKGAIKARYSGKIFMPLYQSQGGEGFFEIKKIKKVWLNLSIRIRKGRFEALLAKLPGVHKKHDQSNVLVVNKNIARFFSTEFMHLLGYRKVRKHGVLVYFTKREIAQGNWPYYLK